MSIDGILNIDKPRGNTSFQVVALVRKWSGARKVGHGGTLDPLATGVLPVCLGRGTKVAEFISEGHKAYRAEIELGAATDTYDAWGQVSWQGDASTVSRQQVEAALASFCGPIEQTPPMFSALKHRGQPLYRLARRGAEVARRRRRVTIYHIELLEFSPPSVTVEVTCGKGTYIRSLAHDLGLALGCGAHLQALTRLRNGPFHISGAVSLAEVADAFRNNRWGELIHPVDAVLLSLAAVIVGPEKERLIMNGRPVASSGYHDAQRCRAYSSDGQLLALLRLDGGLWKADKLLATS